jgi:hypothetical protein
MLCFYTKINLKNTSGIKMWTTSLKKYLKSWSLRECNSHKVKYMLQACIYLKLFLHKLISLLSCVEKVFSGIFHITAVVLCHPHESGMQELFKHIFNKLSEIIFNPLLFYLCFWVTYCLQIKGSWRQKRRSLWNVGNWLPEYMVSHPKIQYSFL